MSYVLNLVAYLLLCCDFAALFSVISCVMHCECVFVQISAIQAVCFVLVHLVVFTLALDDLSVAEYWL